MSMRWLTLPRSCDPVTLLPSLQLGLDSTLLPHHITYPWYSGIEPDHDCPGYSSHTANVLGHYHTYPPHHNTSISTATLSVPSPPLSSRLGTDSQHNERVGPVTKHETPGSVSLWITDVHRILEVGELYYAWYSRTPTRNQLSEIMHDRRDELLSHILRALRLERTGERILTG